MLARRAISLMTKLARPTRIVRYQSTVVTRPQQMTVSRFVLKKKTPKNHTKKKKKKRKIKNQKIEWKKELKNERKINHIYFQNHLILILQFNFIFGSQKNSLLKKQKKKNQKNPFFYSIQNSSKLTKLFRATTTLSNSNKTKLSYSPIVSQLQCRSFAANLLQQPEVADRVLKVVKDFHRVGESVAVSDQSHFIQDLGLDSLDEVELVLAIEDEFAIEIPDADAEKIHSVTDAVKYILVSPLFLKNLLIFFSEFIFLLFLIHVCLIFIHVFSFFFFFRPTHMPSKSFIPNIPFFFVFFCFLNKNKK